MATATISRPAGYDQATKHSDMTWMQRMASKMYLPWALMGLMIMAAAFILGLVLQAKEAVYFAADKATRDAAASGTNLNDIRSFVETTKAWLPAFKFVGLGMLLGSITFLLATILGNLRAGGAAVQRSLGAQVKTFKPFISNVFPMLMMMGMMILIGALVVGLIIAGTANDLYGGNSIAQIDVAPAGADILKDLGTVAAVSAWLVPFKFVGMAVLFSGIAVALLTLIRVLRWQTGRLVEIAEEAKA